MLTELELLAGKDFATSNGILFKHPKMSDLQKYDSNDIYGFTNLFCLQPQDIMVELWSRGVDYETLTNFELFLLLYTNKKTVYDVLFMDFANIYSVEVYKDANTDILILKDSDDGIAGLIDNKIYEELSWFYKKITCFENKKTEKFASQKTKEMILNMEVDSLEEDEKNQKDYLAILLSALVWGNTSGYTWDNVWNLNFYQFNMGIRHIDKIKRTGHILTGIYTGNIDAKKISQKELDWKTI